MSPLLHRHPLFLLILLLIVLAATGRPPLIRHCLLLECDTLRSDTDAAHDTATTPSGFDFHDHHAPTTSYGALEVILVIVEPEVQQNMMLFLLEVDGMGEVPRDEAVL